MIKKLSELELLGDSPAAASVPTVIWEKWETAPTLADLYKPAFEIEDVDEAEMYFAQLVLWRAKKWLRRGEGIDWAYAIAFERTEMAWYALAVDASRVDCCNRGLPPTLAKIRRLYGAYLPFGLGIGERRLDPKAQAAKDRAARKGKPITDFEARLEVRKVQRMRRDDAKRDRPELFDE